MTRQTIALLFLAVSTLVLLLTLAGYVEITRAYVSSPDELAWRQGGI